MYNKPLLAIGQGVRLSNSIDKIKRFIDFYQIPFVTTFLATDILPDHPLNFGRIGIKGNKWANRIAQESDLIITAGTDLKLPHRGYNNEIISKDKVFKKIISHDLYRCDINSSNEWIKKCKVYRAEYKMMEIQSHLINSDNNINLYYFLEKLSDHLPDNAVVIADAGSVFFACPQALKLKEGMRYITSSQAEMGFTLPACVGAAVADNRPVIGLTGDGSFQFNIQELITIRNYNLNVKLFVINNGGYLTIKNTSNKFFNGARNGTDFKFPYLLSLSEAYDIRWDLIDDIGLIDKRLDEIINSKNPCICEVMCDPNQVLLPSL